MRSKQRTGGHAGWWVGGWPASSGGSGGAADPTPGATRPRPPCSARARLADTPVQVPPLRAGLCLLVPQRDRVDGLLEIEGFGGVVALAAGGCCGALAAPRPQLGQGG